jgi:His-Xaa-Ser system radical SAM maturase HxsB
MEMIEAGSRREALRMRALAGGKRMVTCSRDGQFRIDDAVCAQRRTAETANTEDRTLIDDGLVVQSDDRLGQIASAWCTALRRHSPDKLDYLILVPTLRCNLSCSYCQVSRTPIDKAGFDWSEETLAGVLAIIDRLEGDSIKIEFQGGEPTLRCDLIRAVIDQCARFSTCSFVICTNLERLNDEIEALFARADVHISTSLDGDATTHSHNRKGSTGFRANLRRIIEFHGSAKVSALPTIDPLQLPDIDSLIDAYAEFGLTSIFLRPVTYHGFARKRHSTSHDPGAGWRAYHRQFVEHIIARNWLHQDAVMDETYLSICLRRILQPGRERHVDLRQPNPIGIDYVVIDYDGTVYPTDEARMLARSGVIDLAIGDVHLGWDSDQRRLLSAHSTNDGDPACARCAYQPYCGRDVIDDLARYGTIDVPRHETEFCRRHLHMFDLAFELLDSDDPAVRYSLARWLNLPGELPLKRCAA